MRININIELLHGESFDDIVTMLQRTANSLSDPSESMSIGEIGIVFGLDDVAAAGTFEVTK